MENISYERSAYESVDDRSPSLIAFQKSEKRNSGSKRLAKMKICRKNINP